jgi:lysine/ornithine N-monooxygenase
MLSESRKSVIAKIASEQVWSEATRERIARASLEYKEYLNWARQARQKELEFKYEIDSLNMDFEYQRSMNSVKKKEMNIL